MIRITTNTRAVRRAASLLGAGVAALGLLLAAPSPAMADDTDVTVEVTRPLELRGPGDSASLILLVGNSGPEDTAADVVFPLPLAAQGVELVGLSQDCFLDGSIVCELDLDSGDRTRIVAQFRAPDDFSGTTTQRNVVSAENVDGDELDSSDNIVLYTAVLGQREVEEAPAPPPPSPTPTPSAPARPGELSGTVVDRASNAPLNGAKVELSDAKGTRSQVTAAATGKFVWRTADAPRLSSGTVKVTATMPGYQPAVTSVNVAPGGKVGNIKLALTEKPATRPSQSAASDAGGSAGQADGAARGRSTEKFDLVSGVLAGSIGLGALVAIGGIAWMWHGLGPRRDPSDLLPAGHRRRWFGRN